MLSEIIILEDTMLKERGIIIHAQDAGDYWADRLEKSALNVVGIHPAGGHDAHRTMEECIRLMQTSDWAKFTSRMEKAGIAVEYEMHALSWILERERFEKQPEWFRMDENGQRTPKFNCCASNDDALDYIRERSAALAKIFRPDTHKHYFWIDDVASAGCMCEKCRALSPSDQAMRITNAIAEGLQSVDPLAKESYLAYCATLELPSSEKPRDNLFLEFAPISRDFDTSLFDPDRPRNYEQVKNLPALLDFMGRTDAKVLDYWVDNSLFSGWKLPPKEFRLNAATMRADVEEYRKLGFDSITSFGCFLGENYAELYGDAELDEYYAILNA